MEHLLTPLVLGPRTAPNRVVFGPHETNLGRGRALSDGHVSYYERRAAGGAGVIVVEEASVHPSDWPLERLPLASECKDGWRAIAEACRPHGALVIAALGHSGGQGSSAYNQAPLWAPSRVPEVNTREVPKAMEAEDIEAVIAGFADAAAAAVAAGCDGVEVNAGQFSLIRQFLSGLTNHRGDEWADRERFAREVLVAVRAAIGADAVLGLRLSCDELAPWAGITPDMGAAHAASLAEHVDYLTVVRGSIYSVGATRPDGHTPPGFNLQLAREVRDAVRAAHGDRVAVIAQGSIVEVGQAEWALADGAADAVEMTRAQLADANLVAKVRAGDAERVRPCILCNQACMVRDARNPIVSCVVDPRTGHESEEPDIVGTTLEPHDLLVIGAGPAGLEAARVAALRGHRVKVVERADSAGGAVRTAARGPGRERLALAVDWLEAECRRHGVEFEFGHEATVGEDGLRLPGTAVIVATGSRPGEVTYRATSGAVVVPAAAALDMPEDLPDGPILVWDPIGGPIGVSVAEALLGSGREVHLATQDYIVANELARSGDLAPANARLQQAGAVLHRRRVLRAVRKGSADLEDRFTGEVSKLKVAAVVDAGFRLPEDRLWTEVRERGGLSADRAGDAVAPRTILEAVLEGRRVALHLG